MSRLPGNRSCPWVYATTRSRITGHTPQQVTHGLPERPDTLALSTTGREHTGIQDGVDLI
jgi:hypothetical protein